MNLRFLAGAQPDTRDLPVDATDEERLTALIELLSAYVEFYHGGEVTLVDFDGENLKVHLGRACEGCPLSETTLHGWVEGTIRQFFPGLKRVVAV